MAKVKVLSLPKSFTVKRSKWLRGRDGDRSTLCNRNGKMCCLGFLAKASGCTDSDILDQASPWDLLLNKKIQLNGLAKIGYGNTTDSNHLMCINDSNGTKQEARERELKEAFKDLGIKLKFVD
jgi:hypothetical protein